ncbi:MAG: glycosyltransferase [Anaerolineae bacterium]
MRIAMLTFGSRGDVQPYIALGVGLKRAGHAVRLAAPAQFEAFVTSYGLDFVPLPGNVEAIARNFVERAKFNLVRTIQVLAEQIPPVAAVAYRQIVSACADADAIVHALVMTPSGHQMARLFGVPDISAQTIPVFAHTRAFPGVMFPGLPLGGGYNWLTHELFNQAFMLTGRLLYRMVRHQLPDPPGAPLWPFAASNPQRPPLLFGFSPSVIPPPPDWGARVHVTGYWYLDAPDWQPPPGLVDFLAAGPPPVYVGFGSMMGQDLAQTMAVALEALRLSGQRGVIATGWGRAADVDLPDSVFQIDAAPHGWLFPQMAAVVHHGGAGTTSAGLRAGVPTVIVPFAADQLFWGQRVAALGVGPAPIPRRALTAAHLAYAIRVAATHTPMRQRAAALGERIRAEDGVGEAVGWIEHYVHDATSARRATSPG